MQLQAKASKALLALTVAALAVFPNALTRAARAQAITGSIAGRVTDPSGAVVTNATVTIRNTDLSTTARTIVTGRDGAFRASGLISGAYTIDAKADKLALHLCAEIIFPLQSLSSAEHRRPYKTLTDF